MAPLPERPAKRLRGVGLGVELAATLVGFALFGLWVDRTLNTSPWAILISLAVGTTGGFYNFIRASLRELQPPPTSRLARPPTQPARDSGPEVKDSRPSN